MTPHDPRAVAVHDMEGNSLGYIPWLLTDPFHEDPPLEAFVHNTGRFVTREGREVAWASLVVLDR